MTSEVASRKLPGFQFYQNILGSPKYIVAPMVDQSELVRPTLSEPSESQRVRHLTYHPFSRGEYCLGNMGPRHESGGYWLSLPLIEII